MTFQTAGQIHLLFLDGIFIHGKNLLQVNVIWLIRANQNHTLYADMRDCNQNTSCGQIRIQQYITLTPATCFKLLTASSEVFYPTQSTSRTKISEFGNISSQQDSCSIIQAPMQPGNKTEPSSSHKLHAKNDKITIFSMNRHAILRGTINSCKKK